MFNGKSIKVMEFEVSGKIFKIDEHLLIAKPDTKLGKLASDSSLNLMRFDRPLSSFEAILSYYQTNELHLPNNVCSRAFKMELEFWEVQPEWLESCCYLNYLSCLDDHENAKSFYMSLDKKIHQNISKPSKLSRMRNKIWSVLEYTEPTNLAKAYRCLEVGFVLLSLVSLFLGTIESIRQPVDICDYDIQGVIGKIPRNPKITNCLNKVFPTKNCTFISIVMQNNISNCAQADNVPYDELKAELNKITNLHERPPGLFVCDTLVITFFTIELLFRLITCPSLKRYVLSALNMLEVAILLLAYIQIITTWKHEHYKYRTKGTLQILYYSQVFRVFRLISALKNVMAMRVLRESMKRCYQDILVLLMYIIVSVTIFGSFFFFAEDDMSDILESCWWAIITLTTVGYGDIVPKTVVGKIIGSFCAVSGVMILALIIPVFVNTFINLYQLAQLAEKMSHNRTHKGTRDREQAGNRKNLTFKNSGSVTSTLTFETHTLQE